MGVSSDGQLSVGVDVGGTFTDVITYDPRDASLRVLKVPTTRNPSVGVMKGLTRPVNVARRASLVCHATTIATNALLTRSGLAKTALITNEGFRDILEIGRQRRPELYDLFTRRPPPLVRRSGRFTVRCRIDARGSVLEPLDRTGAGKVARRVAGVGFSSVAVSFLNSYLNPSHESAMRDLLAEAGFRGHVSLSSEVDREYREYERTSTTAVNAALVPLTLGYLSDLQSSLRRFGSSAPLYVMNSDGGMSTARFASTHPVTVIESGPAAGVLAARSLAKGLELDRVLTFDMGGTTAKAGAIIDGEPEVVEEFEAAGRTHSGRSIRGSGYAVRGSFIDLAEVSAGGGTVAWVDEGGALAVGPRSAGSDPGPACYGKGGGEPTVTDADVVLGRLNPRHLLGGKMPIRHDLASSSLRRLGKTIGMTEKETAEGIVRLVNSGMSKAVSMVSVERGRDPREFVMISFGGSGPVHSCDLAEELGIREIMVPLHAGLFSAYGLLVAELTRSFSLPVMETEPSLGGRFAALEDAAREELNVEGLVRYSARRFVEARYEGQSHEMLLPYEGDARLKETFDSRHRQVYGYSSNDRVQVVNIKLRATVERPKLPRLAAPPPIASRTRGRREVSLAGRVFKAPVYQRDQLRTGDGGSGPCVIEEYDSTLVVNPSWAWRAESFGTRLVR